MSTSELEAKRKKRAVAYKILILTGILSLFGAAFWWFGFRPYVSTDDARVAMTMARVGVAGQMGRVEVISVSEGDEVTKGTVLLELDHRLADAQVKKAKAKVELSTSEFRRIKELLNQKSATPRDFDKAMFEVKSAEEELKLAELALENTFLKSPLSGRVVQKTTEVGNILDPGQVAFVVADVEHSWIAANIEEVYVGKVKVGQPVSIDIDEGGELKGHVLEVRNAVNSQFSLIPMESSAGNYTKLIQRVPIKISIDEEGIGKSKKALRAGQSVTIKIRVL